MNKYLNYVNELMLNHSPSASYSESSSEPTLQYNGEQETNRPTGGFPPIYICDFEQEKQKQEEVDKTKREFKTRPSAVSIKDIMEKRRKKGKKIIPFI